MTYAEKLRDPRWQKKRLEIMDRDEFQCRDCLADDRQLHVHHCHYERGNPWDTSNDLLLTLCDECHALRQSEEDAGKRSLGLLFSMCNITDIGELVCSLNRAVSDNILYPQIFDGFKVWEDSERWEAYAFWNPEFRPIFQEVTGKVIDWEQRERIASDITSDPVPF